MRASEAIKTKMKGWEGLRLSAYRDSGGVLTIGYGHTGKDVRPGQTIDAAEANRLFESDVAATERQLDTALTADHVPQLNQNQYDALLSFCYNLGVSKARESTLWRKLRVNPADTSIPAEFRRWVYCKGTKLPGLVTRRAEEAMIYSRP